MAAALFTLGWLLRLSSLIDFISETILLGFKAGAGLSIAVTQIPHLLGIPGGGHNFIERVIAIASHPQLCRREQLWTAIHSTA